MINYEYLPAYLSLASVALCPFEINELIKMIENINIFFIVAVLVSR
jgi:hypothetical protein